jgi:pimeloyl-ACP methyl ester carboxylesterase
MVEKLNYKKHGQKSSILVLHGGPGAIGSAAGIANILEDSIEVYSRGRSIDDQCEEIQNIIKYENIDRPIIVGHSWGAYLAYIYAAKYDVERIVMINAGAFDEKYLPLMSERRRKVLTEEEQVRMQNHFKMLSEKGQIDDLDDFGKLASKMDSYENDRYEDELIAFDALGHSMLMKEFNTIRSDNTLLDMGKYIKCPVDIIHGIEDPHPLEGIIEPFDRYNIKYNLHTIEKCGHTPWNEKYGRDKFIKILLEIVS